MSRTPIVPSSGWTVSHWFYRLDRARWQAATDADRTEAVALTVRWLDGALAEEGLQLIPLALVGKGDVGFMAVHPDLRRHQQLGQEIAASGLGPYLEPVFSFLSLSEANEYMSTDEDFARTLVEEQKLERGSAEFESKLASFRTRMAAYAEARKHPQLPAAPSVICFYPMAKSRDAGRNWYTLPFDERKRLMQGHGDTGRRFASRVNQLITSATGLDDWEWGVTLFADDPKAIRDVVYEMRFDPGSAIYGVFGAFYVGIRFVADDLASVLRL